MVVSPVDLLAILGYAAGGPGVGSILGSSSPSDSEGVDVVGTEGGAWGDPRGFGGVADELGDIQERGLAGLADVLDTVDEVTPWIGGAVGIAAAALSVAVVVVGVGGGLVGLKVR